jgi:hypothetical protein
MADHVGLVEKLARVAGLRRIGAALGEQMGPYLSARYQGLGPNDEVWTAINEVENILSSSDQHREFATAAVFRALQGKWIIKRTLTSRGQSGPGEPFGGTAEFHSRIPKSPQVGGRLAKEGEYLYAEQGIWIRDKHNARSKRFIYQFDGKSISIRAADENNMRGRSLQALSFRTLRNRMKAGSQMPIKTVRTYQFETTYRYEFKGAHVQKWSSTTVSKQLAKDGGMDIATQRSEYTRAI